MCATPGMTPTDGPGTTGHIGLCQGLIRQDCPQDPKRLAVIIGAVSLALGFLGVASGVVWQIFSKNGLGPGLVAALVATAGPLGAMVYGVHRKPDDPLPGGNQ